MPSPRAGGGWGGWGGGGGKRGHGGDHKPGAPVAGQSLGVALLKLCLPVEKTRG